jgi:hypothetical protein
LSHSAFALDARPSQAAAAQKKAVEQMLLQHQEGVDTFQRAFIACMDARNYSVK